MDSVCCVDDPVVPGMSQVCLIFSLAFGVLLSGRLFTRLKLKVCCRNIVISCIHRFVLNSATGISLGKSP